MLLGEKQRLFARLVSQLLHRVHSTGYECALAWCYRPPEASALYAVRKLGIPNSLHGSKLAIDLDLFKDGVYLRDSGSHAALGEFWKSLHPDCRWGGDFKRRDGNHYSMQYEGRA